LPYKKFIQSQTDDLLEKDYKKRVTYLGVKLFNRGAFDFGAMNVFEFGFKDAKMALKRAINQSLQTMDERVDKIEESRARKDEEDTYRVLASGYLKCTRPSTEELMLAIKKQFYPSMPCPYLEVDYKNRAGLNDIIIETGGSLRTSLRWLEFNQIIDGEEYIGYRATVSFAKFPKEMYMPGDSPFLYYPASIGLPFITTARFTLIPSELMKKELKKKQQDQEDELKNLNSSGQRVSSAIYEEASDLEEFERTLMEGRIAWASGSYRITVEAPTTKILTEAITSLKQDYAGKDITLVWTSGDQLDLFLEEVFASNIKMKNFTQTTNLSMTTMTGFNLGGIAGDPIG
jgi:hypothetical protein